MYLDYAEDQAERRSPMYMKDWTDKLDAFLKFNDREILQNAGKISQEVAEKLASEQYDEFKSHRLSEEVNVSGDFEEFIKENRLDRK